VDVTTEDLEVYEDGVLQKVDTFQEAVNPVAIVMALDASGSMKNSAELVRTTARDFVLNVRPEDSLALITFADAPKFEHVLALNREWTLDAIGKYTPLGGTALYDALWNSMVHLKTVQGRRAVVVMTDGRDENNPGTAPGSVRTVEEILKLQRDVGAIVYGVGFGEKVDASVLQRLADVSGGQAFFTANAADLGAQFKRVVEGLRRRYVLSYTSTNTTHNGNWRNVEIRVRGTVFVVASGGGYFAPKQ
jgi:Ca-activated chloride channel family protein